MADDDTLGLDFIAPKARNGRGRSYVNPTPANIQTAMDDASLSMEAPNTEPFMEYATPTTEGSTVPISTRVPSSWLYDIDRIREEVHTKLPDFWKTRADFYRWAVGNAINDLRKRAALINSDDPNAQAQIDPVTKVKIFLEYSVGEVLMQATVINDAMERMETIAKAVVGCMAMEEPAQAANFINGWATNASNVGDEFWRSFMGKIMITHAELREIIVTLIREGHIVDEYTIALAEASGAMGESRKTLHNAAVEASLDFTAPTK